MTIISKSTIGFISFILFLMITSGCSSSNPKVIIDWNGESDINHNPVVTKLHLEAINTGDFLDAKNVEAVLQSKYSGKIIAENKIYFGTVKIGSPVVKDTIIETHIPSEDWSTFNEDEFSLEVVKILIDGKETNQNQK